MEPKLLTIEDVMNLLRREASGKQKEFAEKAGVTQQYVSDILRGQRAPGAKILDALGFEKVIVYRKRR